MTAEEQAAADAAKALADAEANKANPKSYSEEEFKKVVAERQEAKEKLRAFEDAQKKAAEEKQKAEGKTSELLTQKEKELAELQSKFAQAEEKAKLFEETQKVLREQALAKITDPDLRKLGEKIQDLNDLMLFSEKMSSPTIPGSPKLQLGQPKDGFFTKDQVNKMSQEDVNRNIEKINESMKSWTN